MKNWTSDASRFKLINHFIVLIIAVVGIAKHNYEYDDSSIFESIIVETIGPIQRSSLSLKESFVLFVDRYLAVVNTSKENEKLRSENLDLKNQIFTLVELEKENSRLKQLLKFGEEIPKDKVLAQVTGWDSSNEFKVLRINKGKNDGLKVMSPVITVNGLVGYVYKTYFNYADILTILDPNNRVDAIISRTRTHGISEGTSDFSCKLKHVIRTEDVQVGDEVVTAGLGNIYPKGIKIGTVSSVNKESYGLTQNVILAPAVDFHRLEEVVVLIESDDGLTDAFQNPYTDGE